MPVSPQDYAGSQIEQSELGVLTFVSNVLSAISNDSGHVFTQEQLDQIGDAVIDVFADPSQELSGENVAEFVIAASGALVGANNEESNTDQTNSQATNDSEPVGSGGTEQNTENNQSTSEPITVPDSITTGDQPDETTPQPQPPRQPQTSNPRSPRSEQPTGQPEPEQPTGQPEPEQPTGQPEPNQEQPPQEPDKPAEPNQTDLPVRDTGNGGGSDSGSSTGQGEPEQPPESPSLEEIKDAINTAVAGIEGAGVDVESLRALGVYLIDYYFSKWNEHSPPITNRYEATPEITDLEMIAAYQREWKRVGKAYELQAKDVEPEQLEFGKW